MDSTFWDKTFENYNSEVLDVFKNDKKGVIRSRIKELASGKKIVGDVGCAIGKWLPFLSPRFREVFAIDFSKACLTYAEKKYKQLSNIHFRHIDMTIAGKEPYRFDVILCVNAILTDVSAKREVFFKNLYAMLANKGHLVLVVPSFESALYSAFVLETCNRKAGINPPKTRGMIEKTAYENFTRGLIGLDKDNVPTKHYLEEELQLTLTELGFDILMMDKVEYGWDTEIQDPPKWLKAPYPWDWLVVAKKRKKKNSSL